jgi:hypothetical protein
MGNVQDDIQITADEILEETHEIEHHLHGNECWLGDAAAPEAGVNEADRYSLTSFQVDSGNNDWGTAVCILGTSDTPCKPGKTKFDLHKILITATERTSEPYCIRWAWGATEADAIAAGNSSETMIYPTATIRSVPVEIQGERIPTGSKVWMNCKCANNTGTINFFIGIHEYDN